MKTNKKAVLGPGMMIGVFLLIVIMIVAGISIGTVIFFGKEYDFRKADASILNYKIFKCFSENQIDYTSSNFESEFYSTCSINKDTINQSNYLIQIYLDNERIFRDGKGSSTQCALAEKNEKFPKCVNSTITKDEKTIFIQTGSNQQAIKRRI
jgi:hypothetical protein